ncbi:MAG: phospholipase D family protein [Pseudomonadota bacterium]
MSAPLGELTLSPVSDRDYAPLVRAAAERAHTRIWVSMFICDIRPTRDVEGIVLDLINALKERAMRGVDVRVVLTGDASAADIAAANLATSLYLQQAGVPVRRAMRLHDGRLGSHAKMIVIDQMAFVGSQNWTQGGFQAHTEDAIWVEGAGVERIASEFLHLWGQGIGGLSGPE